MVFEDQESYVVIDFAGNMQSQLLLAKIEEAIRQLESYFDMHLGGLILALSYTILLWVVWYSMLMPYSIFFTKSLPFITEILLSIVGTNS